MRGKRRKRLGRPYDWRRLALRALGDHAQWSWSADVRATVQARACQTKQPWQRPRRRGTPDDIERAFTEVLDLVVRRP